MAQHTACPGNVPVHLRMCISTVVGWSVLQLSVRSSWFKVLFKAPVSLVIFCLLVLSIIESRILKSSTVIIELSISPLNPVTFYFMYFGLGAFQKRVNFWRS